MKKLEELGISQAPWRFTDDGMGECDIRCSGVPYGEDYEGDDIIAYGVQKKDAQMASAAPKLYKALYELVEAYEACNAHDWTCENCERRKMCQQDEERIIANAKSALAEAAGEGGENK